MYNFKRALGIGFVMYLATFVVGIAAGILTAQDMSSMNTIDDTFWYVGMVTSVIVAIPFTLWYLKSPTITPSLKSGAYFGLTVVGLAFALDIILFTIGNMTGAGVDLMEYYGDIRFWITVLLVIGTAKLVGYLKAPKVAGTPTV